MTRSRTMLQRIAIALFTLVLICTALLGGLLYWATPTMVVQNDSELTVQVTAHWGDSRKMLQPIKPGDKRTFKVRGESAIEFVATYPDGTQVTSRPMYFTTATTVTAVVTDSGVEATAEL
ncbi:hypothetical protein [Pseudomonas lopnurensis]|uniref:hypothetical protein n=1 Tax=Pseudomonas lopnurensis TaxID=1477517 RepID=UPI0028B15B53|nr:hypothetical protein [Pseudomonas lopnurensis]